jgi:hypothetical protein
VTRTPNRRRQVAGLHAGYLIATGLWSLVHRRSFEAVTGPKRDFWLVRTVGGLAIACGVTLGAAVLRGNRSPDAQLLAAAQAVAFGCADVYAAASGSRIYLGDAALQAACLPSWLRPWDDEAEGVGGSRSRGEPLACESPSSGGSPSR